jgi:hypothetical protein
MAHNPRKRPHQLDVEFGDTTFLKKPKNMENLGARENFFRKLRGGFE